MSRFAVFGVITTILLLTPIPVQAGLLGDPVITNAGSVDGWRSNLIIDEGRTYQNTSGSSEWVTLDAFTFAVGANRSRVTPFVVRLNDVNGNGDFTDDNNFTILRIGDTRISGVDYASTGVFSYPFTTSGSPAISLGPNEMIAAAFIDADPTGSHGDYSVIPMNGSVPSGAQWYNGTSGWPHPSPPAPLLEGNTFGGAPSAGVQNRNYEFQIAYTAGPPRIEVAGDGITGGHDWQGVEQNVVTGALTGAKFIQVVQNIRETMQVTELEAYETGTGTNVAAAAHGGTATATSDGWGGIPANAIDGNLSSGNWWHSAGWDMIDATLTIELASPSALDFVRHYNRAGFEARGRDFNLIISDASGATLFNERILNLGTWGDIPVDMPLSGEAVATLPGGHTFVFELDDGGAADVLSVINPYPAGLTSVLDVNGAALEIELVGSSYALGDSWQILDAAAFQGEFSTISVPLLADNLFVDTSSLLIDGTIAISTPEPGTLALLGVGLAVLARRRRRS